MMETTPDVLVIGSGVGGLSMVPLSVHQFEVLLRIQSAKCDTRT